MNAGKRAVQDALDRRGMEAVAYQPGWAQELGAGFFSHKFALSAEPSVTIIIPTRDQVEVLRRCVDSVLNKTDYHNYEILIIDNESEQPQTVKYLNELSAAENVRVLRISNPEGKFSFAYINNRAARSATSDYVLFLNNDTEVINGDWLTEMVGYARVSGVGGVGARLFYPDKRIQHAGVLIKFYHGLAGHAFKGMGEQDAGYLGYAKVSRNYTAVTAACLLTPRELFLEMGGFDEERFKVAYNDVDLCARLVESGYRLVYTPEAELIHHEGFSRGFCDDPRENANFKESYYGKKDRYYNPSLSLDNECFEVWPRSVFTGSFDRPVKTLMCAHNLNHEGAPYSQFELTVGLKERGVIDPVVLSPADGPLRALYESCGIEVVIAPGLGCIFDWSQYNQRIVDLKAFLQERGVGLVYANTVINFHVISAAHKAGLPSIWNIRESEPWEYYQNLWGAELTEEAARCFTYAYKVVFVAHTTKHGYSRFEASRNFHVIYNGLNIDRLTAAAAKFDRETVRAELGVKEGELCVLLPGTVCERKGQHDLAHALALMSASALRKIRCFIVGDWDSPFPYNGELHRIAASLPAEAKERLTILPISSEIFKFYKAADIFVCTSRIESFPRIILEAMAFGLPVVTTPVFGIQEQVQRDVNALFYSPGDHGGLAHAIDLLVVDDGMRRKFSINSPHVLRQLETFDEMVSCYATLFSEGALSVGAEPVMPEGIELHPAQGDASHPALRKVTFLAGYKDENSQRFRVYNLIEEMNRRGIACAVVKEDFAGSMDEVVTDTDVLVAFRVSLSPNVQRILTAFKRGCVPTIFDVDDLVFEPESAHLLHGLATLGDEDHAKALAGFQALKETLLFCDYATCTTPALAQRMERHGKRAFVIANSISSSQMAVATEPRGPRKQGGGSVVRIGYFSGTKTHEKDFQEVSDALYDVMLADNRVEFHLVGALDLDARFSRFGERVVRQPLMDFLEMLRYLAEMDINLAPLEMDNAFTACKSELKIFEAALLGIPTVASATDSYARCISDGVNGLLACDKEEWREKLERLIGDGDLRARVARAAQKDFTARFSVENVVDGAIEVYSALARSRSKSGSVRFLVVKEGLEQSALKTLDRQLYRNWALAPYGKVAGNACDDDMVVFVGDGALPESAFFELAQYLSGVDADLIYADEATLSGASLADFHFKPDWSPDLFRNRDYITNFFAVRGGLLKQVGNWRSRYDLVLKASELSQKVVHVPKVLFHVRRDVTRIDDAALLDHLKRMKLTAVVKGGLLPFSRRIEYQLAKKPLLSVIIPNKDGAEVLEKCISSILGKSSYRNVEIIIMENGSVKPETFAYYKKVSALPEVRIVKWEKPFNYSAVNNEGARAATGEVFLFLNNDVEVISPDWLERMLEYAVREDVGCVGAKLYYPDDTVQHGGVTLGLGGVAGHSHKDFGREDDGYFGRLKVVQNVSAVTAACVMMRKEVFEKVHGFDEGYPIAFNDVDLCLKIRKEGYLIVWTPFAELYHDESKTRGLDTTPEKRKRFQLEVSRFMEKWFDVILQGDPYYNVNLTLRAGNYHTDRKRVPSAAAAGCDLPDGVRDLFLESSSAAVPVFSYFAAKAATGIASGRYLSDSFEEQSETLRRLESERPSVVWLDSCSRLSSLMSYRIYRWFLQEGYRYCNSCDFHFLVDGNTWGEAELPGCSEQEEVAGLTRLFHLEDLHWLPTMWGRTPVLEEHFAPSPSTVTVVGTNNVEIDDSGWGRIERTEDPHLIWKISPPLDGNVYDFVKVDVECRPKDEAQFLSQFFWAGAGEGLHEDRQFCFTTKVGDSLLIPVGSHPGWLKNNAIDTIRFDIDNYIGEFRIKSLSFWGLTK